MQANEMDALIHRIAVDTAWQPSVQFDDAPATASQRLRRALRRMHRGIRVDTHPIEDLTLVPSPPLPPPSPVAVAAPRGHGHDGGARDEGDRKRSADAANIHTRKRHRTGLPAPLFV